MKIGKWDTRPIHTMCSAVVDCVNKTAPSAEAETGYKMIRTTNVRNGWVDVQNVKHVEQAVYEKWIRRGRPLRGDVILTREAPLGGVGMLRSDDQVFLGQRTVMYRADPAEADPRFLLYALMSPWVQAEIKSLGSGATVEHMRVPDCEQLTVPSPPIETQQRIGAALGAFDDLIENNRRRIEILEEMARLLYREWFVHFRFPGHENIKLVESDLGPVPEGWMVGTASRVLHINPRTKVDKAEEHPFITMGDLRTSSMVCEPSEWKAGNSGAKFLNGDTLFARITPCLENGKTGFVQCLDDGQAGRGSTEFIVLRGKDVGCYFTYLLARDDNFRRHARASMSGASGRQRVQNECFDNYLLAVPDEAVEKRFHEAVAPMFRLIQNLHEQCAALSESRDLLLPRLISGELDVSAVDVGGMVAP